MVEDMCAREPMPAQREQLLDENVERMLGMVDRARFRASRRRNDGRTIAIAGTTIILDQSSPAIEHQLERLASAIEATIAYERATAMLAMAGTASDAVPLWLVTGSSVLAQWLAWSRGEAALRRVLALSNRVDSAPIAGTLQRTARVALGQTAVNIRVRNGLAVAGKIKLSAQRHCSLALGQTARLTITGGRLPETIVAALAGRGVAELGSHPFFTAANLVIAAARNEGRSLVIDLKHDWRPLMPMPETALAVVPADADPACPWRPTGREVAELYDLVDSLRGHERSA